MVVCCQSVIKETADKNVSQVDGLPILNYSYEKTKVTEKIVSSGLGALLTSIVVTPLDVVRTRLQAQEKAFAEQKCFVYYNGLWDHICYCDKVKSNPYHSASNSCIWYRRPSHFTGTFDAFIKITRNEGITSLWSGLPPTLIMAVPATVLYFTVYDQLRESMCQLLRTPCPPVWATCIAGTCARVITVTAVNPVELIRTKMLSEPVKYSDIFKSVAMMTKQLGYLSLWRGWTPTILRDVPFSVIYWSAYESLKQNADVFSSQPSIFFCFIAGATAGAIAAVITYPLDIVKTYRQIELGDIGMFKSKRNAGTKDILLDLYKRRGMKVFYIGLLPRLIKIAPSCAIMISCYEYGKTYFLAHKEKI